ncbi:MAG: cytochrome P450 [Acidimicrobiales bacterium]
MTSIETVFNPFDTGFMTVPGTVLAQAREESPVFFSPIINSWVVTRYDDVVGILREPSQFSSKEVLSIVELLSPEIVELFGDEIPMEGTLTGVDEPDHGRLRKVLQPGLSPEAVAAYEPMIRARCDILIDNMMRANQGDLVSQFAYPLPLNVISEIIGMPRDMATGLRQVVEDWAALSTAALFGVSLEEQILLANRILEAHRLCARLIEQRYRNPRGDLLSLVAAGRDSYQLTPREMLSLVPGLFLAGHEPSANILTSMFWHLLSVPDRYEALLADPNLGPRYLEETLRLEAPVFGMWRISSEDAVVGGQEISAGQRVFLAYLSANRDSSHYSDPDEFSIERERVAPHLAFGRGIHSCIGAPLARLEGRVALEVITTRMPRLQLHAGFSPTYQPHPFLRGMAELPVTW